jgi:Spy/CpxP family protein refolding chaperone
MKATKVLSIIAVVALVGSVGAFTLAEGAMAQGMGKGSCMSQGSDMGKGAGMGPGMDGMSIAERILKKARHLDLGDEELATLEGVVKDASARMKSLHNDKRTAHMALKTLMMAKELDKAAVATESDKLAEVQKSIIQERTSLMMEIREKMGVEFVTGLEAMKSKGKRGGHKKGHRDGYRSGDCDNCRPEYKAERREERRGEYRGDCCGDCREDRRHRHHHDRCDRCDETERRVDRCNNCDKGHDRGYRGDCGSRD